VSFVHPRRYNRAKLRQLTKGTIMATLQELRSLFSNSDLMEKIEAATVIAANDLIGGTPSADDQRWAAVVFSSPASEARKAMMAVLASNNTASVAAIIGASDAAIQGNVDDVVATLVVANTAGA